MTRRQKEPLRALTSEERQELERISRATSDSATRVVRAKALLAVAQGLSYTAAAQGLWQTVWGCGSAISRTIQSRGISGINPKAWRRGESPIHGTTTTANFSHGTTATRTGNRWSVAVVFGDVATTIESKRWR